MQIQDRQIAITREYRRSFKYNQFWYIYIKDHNFDLRGAHAGVLFGGMRKLRKSVTAFKTLKTRDFSGLAKFNTMRYDNLPMVLQYNI